MTDPTDNNTGPSLDPMQVMAMLNSTNPKPDTAQGVADILRATTEMVESRMKAEIADIGNGDIRIPIIIKPDGRVDRVPEDWIEEAYGRPTFRRGTAVLRTLDSFIDHVNRFGDDDSAVFAMDGKHPYVEAVLDYHRKDTLSPTDDGVFSHSSTTHGEYRFGNHRSRFDFPISPEWEAWTAMDGESMSMTDFAHFLEDRVLDVAEMETVPEKHKRFVEIGGGVECIGDWATLTRLSRGLTIYENATVGEVVNLANGTVQMEIRETQDTEVDGVKITMPTMFFLTIPIFVGGDLWRIPVRLRHRKNGRFVTFKYELWNADAAFRDAFNEAVAKVGASTPAQVFFGRPE